MGRDELLDKAGDERVRLALEKLDQEHQAQRDALLALFEEAPIFMTVLEGPELEWIMLNRRVRESPRGPSLLGKTARELYPEDHPVFEALMRAYTTGVEEIVEEIPPYFADDAGSERYYTLAYTPLFDAHGKVHRVLSSAYEVTAAVQARRNVEESDRRSRAELQRLFALLEEAPVFINLLEGPELRIIMSNRRSRELFGNRNWLGAAFSELVPSTNATLQAARRVLVTGVPETFEVVSRDLEGFVGRSFANTVVPIKDPEVMRVMTASVETTEQRRAREALETQAQALEQARRQAVEASRAKDEFLAMLGHELRNPLAPMLTTLDLLRLRGTASRELDVLERQVRHLTRLVDDLLDVSRIARGVIELDRQDLDLRTAVNRALEMTNPLLEQRRHRILTDLSPVAVRGDADRLAQVVANLITNAAKYSEPGSPISIRIERRGALAELSVEDRGIGIAPDMIDRVFDAFVQQPQMLARSRGGLGLGLSIVKGLVEAHGGKVSAHSAGPGTGSRFMVALPAVDAPSPRLEAPRHLVRPGSPTQRILVVDDNHDAAMTLNDTLVALGYTVAIAHDGPSALAKAASFVPDIGLLDIGLPVMDGYELALALRAARSMLLVAITGYGQESDRQRSREAGFEGHLVKPVGLEDLVRLLEELAAR